MIPADNETAAIPADAVRISYSLPNFIPFALFCEWVISKNHGNQLFGFVPALPAAAIRSAQIPMQAQNRKLISVNKSGRQAGRIKAE